MGSSESQASDVGVTTVESLASDLQARSIASDSLHVETTYAGSARSQGIGGETAPAGSQAFGVETVSDGSETFAGSTSVELDNVAQATPVFEAEGITDERDNANHILMDEAPIFTSVDQRPPEFPPANYSNIVKRWAKHIINVEQLLQLLIDVIEYFSTKGITFNQENFEQFCGRDMLPRLDCTDFGELIHSEIILIRPEDFGFYLNPIFGELRFLVLTDLEWSIFRILREVDNVRIEDLADSVDFGSECDWTARKRRAAVWEVLFSEKLRGVFVVEAVLRPGQILDCTVSERIDASSLIVDFSI